MFCIRRNSRIRQGFITSRKIKDYQFRNARTRMFSTFASFSPPPFPRYPAPPLSLYRSLSLCHGVVTSAFGHLLLLADASPQTKRHVTGLVALRICKTIIIRKAGESRVTCAYAHLAPRRQGTTKTPRPWRICIYNVNNMRARARARHSCVGR